MKRAVILVALISLISGAVGKAAVTFDFEGVTSTALPRAGAYTLLVMTQDGVTATLIRTSGAAFDIVWNMDTQAGKPLSWGGKSLDPFVAQPAGDAFLVDFSLPVLAFSTEFGDYGPSDDDSPVTLAAYSGPSGTGSLVGTDSAAWDANAGFPGFGSLSISSGLPFRSVLFTSAGRYANSLFWDNLTVVPVSSSPTPGALVLGGIGLGLLGWLRARRVL